MRTGDLVLRVHASHARIFREAARTRRYNRLAREMDLMHSCPRLGQIRYLEHYIRALADGQVDMGHEIAYLQNNPQIVDRLIGFFSHTSGVALNNPLPIAHNIFRDLRQEDKVRLAQAATSEQGIPAQALETANIIVLWTSGLTRLSVVVGKRKFVDVFPLTSLQVKWAIQRSYDLYSSESCRRVFLGGIEEREGYAYFTPEQAEYFRGLELVGNAPRTVFLNEDYVYRSQEGGLTLMKVKVPNRRDLSARAKALPPQLAELRDRVWISDGGANRYFFARHLEGVKPDERRPLILMDQPYS
jgi:hypothetical protein